MHNNELNSKEIISQATILILNREVLILERKQPYGLADNVISFRHRKNFTLKEREDIVKYLCGNVPTFEDKYDFPKGRGSTFKHALKEVEEETGYKIQYDNIIHKILYYKTVSYEGLDEKKYKIELHLVFLKDKPKKTRTGEIRMFKCKWMNLNDAIKLFKKNVQYDERSKTYEYFNLLKNVLDYCVKKEIF